MRFRSIVVLCGVFGAEVLGAQQSSAPTLKSFFEKRLSDPINTTPPSYEALLKVMDSVARTSQTDIQGVVPLLNAGLKSGTPNVSIEAIFAFFEISRRPDGGALLQNSVPEIASLMRSPDERLSGGSVTILRNLTRSIPNTTIPVLVNELKTSGKPTFTKAEIVRTLLESSRRNDDQVLRTVEAYLGITSDPAVRAANLHAIAANRVETPVIAGYALSSLNDGNKQVQVAAIETVYALSSDVFEQGCRQTGQRPECR